LAPEAKPSWTAFGDDSDRLLGRHGPEPEEELAVVVDEATKWQVLARPVAPSR